MLKLLVEGSAFMEMRISDFSLGEFLQRHLINVA